MTSERPDAPPPAARGASHTERTESIRLKERIYAVITMVAVVVALAEESGTTPGDAAWTICGTALGVWLATLVADQQAHRVVHLVVARGIALRTMLYTSSAQLLSAVGPLLFTGAAWLGVMGLHSALLAAVCVELVGLFGWGVLGGLRLGGGPIAAFVAGLADLVIGLLIVVIKVATH